MCTFGRNTSKDCSRIIVVHVVATVFFLKFTQRATILQTVLNQEVTLKRLISILGLLKSCMLGRKVIYLRCINCSYNNVARGIDLLDKKAFFAYTGKNFMQVRAFERYIPSMSVFLKNVTLVPWICVWVYVCVFIPPLPSLAWNISWCARSTLMLVV